MEHFGILTDFQKEKEHLRRSLEAAETLFLRNGWNRFLTEAHALKQKLVGNIFNLVVMGQFKRGKSTLINAMLGQPLLPTAVVPLTSVVTILRYGESLRVTVHFLNGSKQAIALEELSQYVTEKLNPENVKGVDRVEIEYPAELLRDGVQLIDTPGVGSVFEHNTDVAYQFMPRADVVLFLVTADPPVSQAELHFLQDVRAHAAKIFFVKNKVDHLAPGELEESLQFTRQVLSKHLQLHPDSLTLFPISAKWALEARRAQRMDLLEKSGLLQMEQALEKFLMREKGNLILNNSRRRARHLVGEAITLLELEMKALQMPQAQLAEKIATFRREQGIIQQEKEDIQVLLQGGLRRIMENYDEEVTAFKKGTLPELERWLRLQFEATHEKTGVRELAQLLETKLRSKLESVFTHWRKIQEEKTDRAFAELAGRLSARVNAVIDRIYETAGNLFELRIDKYETREHLAAEKYFYFKVGGEISALEPFENLLTYGVAALVSKKILLNKTLSELPRQFDKQCGRVRADLLERLQESGFRFLGQMRERIDQAYSEIDDVVQRAMQERDPAQRQVNKRTAELQQMITHLR
ncbi:MAG: hypothetical protein D6813_14745, partial [Calditrichaeota bacterium]